MAPVRAHLKSRDLRVGRGYSSTGAASTPDLGEKVEEGVRANLNGNRA
jgi:hypothetical protein